jgi:hypothetical protein
MGKNLRLHSPVTCVICTTLAWLEKRRLEHASSTRVLFSLALAALIGCTAAMFGGVGPFSSPKEAIVGLVGTASESTSYYGMSEGGPEAGHISVHHDVQPPYARTPWEYDRIRLVNSDRAADPTWEQLTAFLIQDKTDEKEYDRAAFPCGAFAEEIHNNAETSGIRAAWVVVEFEGDPILHALNAFNTIDKGLVWIDSTDSWLEPDWPAMSSGWTGSQDKVAYLAIGREYGLVSLEAASCPDYACYDQYERRKLDLQNSQEEYYRLALTNMSQIGTHDVLLFGEESPDTLAATLGTQRDDMGPYWGPLGTVSSVEVYW